MTAGNPNGTRRDLAEAAAERGEIINQSGGDLGSGVRSILCVPIRDRQEEIRAVAQLVNKRAGDAFTPADERAFRDFARPLGIILESCERAGRLG
jgi:hypothetical protein